jgi:ubiquinone/menaquinone biosynthesis C-methylase UbiE
MQPEPASSEQPLKAKVREHWSRQPCGTRDIPTQDRSGFFKELERERYDWEPYIRDFASFERARGKRLLEVGVGAGTDFINWVRSGAVATGIDLTEAGIALAKERLELEGLSAALRVADAENLPFQDESFEIVYSYGVLHHSPNTSLAVGEVRRVLQPGGTALVMVYHSPSWTAGMLWVVHCLLKGRPWRTPSWAMGRYLESPGTKAYTLAEARKLFAGFREVRCWTQLSHGDLLMMRPSEKYGSRLYRFLWRIYPRWLVRLLGNRFGTGLMVEAVK